MSNASAIRISRRSWLLAGLAIPLRRALAEPPLEVTWDGDNIHVAAPQLHFITGKPLERLKNGASVVFLSQVTLSTDRYTTVFRRMPERFVISYDLWEENFSVATIGSTRRTASRLTAGGAEAWCLENVAISALGLAPDRPFWLRFELRAADPKEESEIVGDAGINLTRLIEIFSRRPGTQQPHWVLDAGPLRLAGLRRLAGRIAKNG